MIFKSRFSIRAVYCKCVLVAYIGVTKTFTSLMVRYAVITTDSGTTGGDKVGTMTILRQYVSL